MSSGRYLSSQYSPYAMRSHLSNGLTSGSTPRRTASARCGRRVLVASTLTDGNSSHRLLSIAPPAVPGRFRLTAQQVDNPSLRRAALPEPTHSERPPGSVACLPPRRFAVTHGSIELVAIRRLI